MQKLSEQILEQRIVLNEVSGLPGLFPKVLQASVRAIEASKEQGLKEVDAGTLTLGMVSENESLPPEIRTVLIFEGIGLSLPTTYEELHKAIISANDYFEDLSEHPELLAEVIAIHDVFFKSIGVEDEFQLEHVFLSKFKEDATEHGNASNRFPYNIRYNRKKLEESAGFQFNEVLVVVHEFVHRYRHSDVLAHTETQYSRIEEGIAQLVALRFCEEMGLESTYLVVATNPIELMVLDELLSGVSSKDIMNMSMDELSSKIGFQASKLEALLNREVDLFDEKNKVDL